MDAKNELKNEAQERQTVLGKLIREGAASTQEDLCRALKQKGFTVTQSTVSRDLRRIAAIKTLNGEGEVVYRLPEEIATLPPTVSDSLGRLLIDVESNESMIVLHTTPGSASLVARHLDHRRESLGILGTIAGDDTIFIAPRSTKQMSALIRRIKAEF